MGFCLGTANIIPGVSGGTFLLVFKIYERVFAVLNQVNKSCVLEFGATGFQVLKNFGRNNSALDFIGYLKERDFFFLGKLIFGALTAILTLSSLMKYLLVHHFSMTYSLFFGLILVSIVIPVKMLDSLKGYLVFFALLGMVLTISVSWLVNPYDKVKIKSNNFECEYQLLYPDGNPGQATLKEKHTADKNTLNSTESPISAKKSNPTDEPGFFAFTGKYTMGEYVYACVCGAVAISAMVLPGISGSLVLILMGAYFDIISALAALKSWHMDTLIFLGCFGMGIVAGGLVFARLINFALKRYYNATMAFLIGLMAGSLYALWPFKKVIIMARQYVRQDNGIGIIENSPIYTNINILPQASYQLFYAFVFFLLGCGIMYVFIRAESSRTF
ncbi:MAG: DUF368 domain-containing protein [Desulfobacula sp.]|nr:DUF368 domain-containing protein [Desulfobacula sp.]